MFFPPKSRFKIQSSYSSYIKIIFSTIFGSLNPGRSNISLEKKVKKLFKVDHAYGINQARVGIYLAVKAVVNENKNEIIMSPYTIFDVVNMVICAGGKPVFVDIDKQSCNIEPNFIENAVNENTAAVIATHLHGVPCDMNIIKNICEKNKIYLIEDSAQAFGVPYDGKILGTIGDIGIYSFGLFKTINSFFGGMVVCHDKHLMDKMRSFTKQFLPNPKRKIFKRIFQSIIFDLAATPIIFKLFTFWVFRFGYLTGNPYLNKLTRSENNPELKTRLPNDYKCLMSNVQASIVHKQLNEIYDKLEIRQKIANVYYESLKSVEGIVIPEGSPMIQNGCLQYPIQAKDRHSLLVELMRKGRDCAPQHIRNCADLAIFKEYYVDCPISREVSKSVVILPTYPQYGVKEAKKNVRVISSIFN